MLFKAYFRPKIGLPLSYYIILIYNKYLIINKLTNFNRDIICHK